MKKKKTEQIQEFLKDCKAFVIAILIFIIVLLGNSVYSYIKMKKETLKQIDERLHIGALTIKNILLSEFHDRAIDKESISIYEDDQNIRALSDFANKAGFKFLYTLVVKGDDIYITSSNATEQELADNEEVRYFTIYQEADSSFQESYNNDCIRSFTHKDRWGIFRALVVPEVSPGGNRYLSVAELDISSVDAIHRQKTLEAFIHAVLIVIGSLPLIFVLYSRLRHSVEQKQKTAQLERMVSQRTKKLEESERKLKSIIENSTNLFYTHTVDHKISFISPQVRDVLGYEPEEVMQRWTEFITDNPINEQAIEFTEKAIKTGERQPTYLLEMKRRDGKKIIVEVREAPVVENGKVISIVGSLTDITEQKKAEEKLKLSEEKHRIINENVPVLVYAALPDEHSTSVFLSGLAEELTGYTSQELMDDSTLWAQIIHPDDANYVWDKISEHRRIKSVLDVEYRIITKDNEVKWIHDKAKPLLDDKGNILQIQGFMEDITKRKKAEQEIIKQTTYLENLIDSSPEAIVILDNEDRILKINPEFERIFGYTVDESVGKKIIDLVVPDDLKDEGQKTTNDVAKGKNIRIDTIRQHKNGKKIHVSILGKPIVIDNKQLAVYRIYRDISIQKESEKIQVTIYKISKAVNTIDNISTLCSTIQNILNEIIDTSNFYVALYDEERNMITLPYIVDQEDDFTEFPPGKTLSAYVIQTGKPLLATREVVDDLTSKGLIETIGSHSAVWLGVPLKLHNEVIGLIGLQSYDDPEHYTEKDLEILNFVSEEIAIAIQHIQYTQDIKRELKEKEVLLSEIHHRVKNNLQTLLGLLQLQQETIKTKEDAIRSFEVSQDRIFAMARVYDMLLRSDYMSEVSLGAYILSVAEHIKRSYDHHNKIELVHSFDDFYADTVSLGKVGLIINELITNAMKYAFADRDKGIIFMGLKISEKSCEIEISDNGIGLPKDVDFEGKETLGLSLVSMMIRELKGKLTYKVDNGTRFIIEIPKVLKN